MTKTRDAKPVAAKRSRTKAVAKVEKVPGRLIDKLTVEDGQLTVTGGEDARAAMRKALATSSPDFEALSLTQLTNILKPSGSDDVTVQMNAAIWRSRSRFYGTSSSATRRRCPSALSIQ